MIQLERLEVSGSPAALGRGQGEAFRERIRSFVEMRFEAMDGYFHDRGYRSGDHREKVLGVGTAAQALYEAWDPEGHAEQVGIAEGAGVDPLRLYTACNMTDFRDAVLLAAPEGPRLKKLVDEGCSSVLVPGSHGEGGRAYAGQTWDLNPPDVAYVVAVKRSPTEGPKTWSVTCTGCLTLVGMNEHGLSVGTTNVKTYGSRAGVGYLSILHRAIRENDVAAARAIVENAPHAGAHTYWLADADSQIEFEASPNALFLRETSEGPVWRTNHCIFDGHQKLEGEVRGESSEKRFARLGAMLKPADGSKLDVAALKTIFADRTDGLLSINRYEEDAQGTATNAVFIGSPSERKAWACRGPADRGEWVELGF